MKKNRTIAFMTMSLIAFLMTSCTGNVRQPATIQATARVTGTAVRVASDFKAAGDRYVLDSVESVMIDGRDVKSELVPSNPEAISGDRQNNVIFEAAVELPETITFTAEAKPGYVFSEWVVMQEEGKKTARDEIRLLDEIEDFLEKNNLEHSETVTIPARYLSYLIPEYDNGFHVDLDAADDRKHQGSKSDPFSVAEFTSQDYKEDEIALILSGSNQDNLGKLISKLTADGNAIEEIKLIAEDARISAVPAGTFEELYLSGFTFSEPVIISSSEGEFKFENCKFEASLTISGAKEVELRNCTLQDVEISSAGEVELINGTAENISITASEIEEAELRNLKIAGRLDLSAITSGEVELKQVSANEIIEPATPDFKTDSPKR